MSDGNKALMVTPEATLRWAHLFTAKAGKPSPDNPSPKAKFMCDLIFSPEAMATPEFAAMKAAAQATAIDFFGEKLQGLIAAEKFISPFWKCERKLEKDGSRMKGYVDGGVYITIKSIHRPNIAKITASGMVPVIDENDLYDGCTVRASIDCYPYDTLSRGVSFGLYNILKVRDGAKLGGGGGSDIKSDFAAFIPAGSAGGGAGAGSADSLF